MYLQQNVHVSQLLLDFMSVTNRVEIVVNIGFVGFFEALNIL
jgi:hypothetical protein